MKKQVFLFFLIVFSFFDLFSQDISVNSQDLTTNLISTESFSLDEIQNIDINITYENLKFSNIYGNEITVDIYGNNNKLLPKATLKENTLYITSFPKKITPGDICKIIIYLPENIFINNFFIKSQNTSNSVIKLPKINISNVKIETNSNSIDCGNLQSSKLTNIKIKSNTGNINFNRLNTQQLYAITESGNITLNGFKGEYVLLKAGSFIKAVNIISDYFEIITKNGDISVSLRKIIKGSSYVKNDNGNISLGLPKSSSFNLSVYSIRGTFKDKILNKKTSPKHGYKNSYNNGGPEIKIETINGNVELYNNNL